ncbi:MAG: hypothetical protein U9Q22_00305, partial [Candidatus Altiarchaeota archaeon]|nr:hypothetical protein [Candidatus Altiarchaeota archaeon]
PAPCELQGLRNHQKPCTDYTSKETYDCITNTINKIKNTEGGIYIKGHLHLPPTKKCFQDPECNKYTTLNLKKMKPHNPPTNQQTLVNILLLTLEGYLLTSLIIYIGNKLRKKIPDPT